MHTVDAIGRRLYELNFECPDIASRDVIEQLLKESAREVEGHKFSLHFLMTEWEQVVDAWQLENWEAYRDVARLGRKTRLPESRRVALWGIFECIRSGLDGRGLVTFSDLFNRLASQLAKSKHRPFDFVVVDESQDVSVPQLRFLAVLGGHRQNNLFFAGDLGQRIFQQPFSWKSLGVEIRGRCRTLRINYRTSHQIRMQAGRLLGTELSDVDGNVEERRGTMSVFNGPEPTIMVLDTSSDEIATVAQWIEDRGNEGVMAHEIGVFVRSGAELDRARAAVLDSGLPFKVLDEKR